MLALCLFTEQASGRQLINFGNPLMFELMEQDMRKIFSRIRTRCEVLLAQRVDQLANELKGTDNTDDACRILRSSRYARARR
jgi:hypothetical protein